MMLISKEGVGALIYLRDHDGRGIGLGQKIRAYALQDSGTDTVANSALRSGSRAETRIYTAAESASASHVDRVRCLLGGKGTT